MYTGTVRSLIKKVRVYTGIGDTVPLELVSHGTSTVLVLGTEHTYGTRINTSPVHTCSTSTISVACI